MKWFNAKGKGASVLALVLLLSQGACRPTEFVLVENGRSAVRIRPSGDAQVDRDIVFFTNAVCRSTGALLDAGENEIVFEVVKRPIPEEDAYEVTFPSPHEMRIRGTNMSCRWALNEILERDMGVCFCFPGPHGTHYPRLKTVSIPRVPRAGTASLKLYRELYLEDPAWARALGGKSQKGNFYHHNLFDLFPVEKYGKDPWREKIMPQIKGVRKPPKMRFDAWQPCMASQESVDEAVKNILAHLAKHPDQKVYSLGMNDNGGFCECDGCRRMNGGDFDGKVVYGSPRHRNRSRVYYTWVNRVADQLAQTRPDVMLGLLAYNELVDPPPFPLRANVAPGLCRSIHQTMARPRRESYEAWMKAWNSKCTSFGINDYAYGARSYTPPRMYMTRADEFLRLHDGEIPSLDGFFAEGSSFIGEGPKRWFLLKRAFDTHTPKDVLLGRWYDACCGKSAAPYLKAYYDRCEAFWTGEAIRETRWYASVTNGAGYCDFKSMSYLPALSRDFFAEGTALMDKVVAAANADGDTDQRERARRLKRFDDFYVARALACGFSCPKMLEGLKTAADALAFLEAYPGIVTAETNAVAIAEEIVAEKRREPFVNSYVHENGMLISVRKNGNELKCAGILPRFATDPKVLAAMKRAADDPRLPRENSAFLKAMVEPDGLTGRNWLWTAGLDDEAERRLWAERDDYGFEVAKVETKADGDRQMTLTARPGWQATAKDVGDFPSDKFCIYTVRVRNPLDRKIAVELVAGGIGGADVRTNFPVGAGETRVCTVGFRTPLLKPGPIKWPLRFYITTGGVPLGKSIYVDRMAVRAIE